MKPGFFAIVTAPNTFSESRRGFFLNIFLTSHDVQ
jgi:hypothetical protein